MRDDSRVEIYVLCLLVLVLLVYAVFAVWRGPDDHAWEVRWAGLDDLDRTWIAAASRSRDSRGALEERGELGLAQGFSRREARQRAYILLATLLPLLIVAILMVTGLISDRFAPLLIGSFALLQSLIALYRERRIKNRYRETQDSYLGSTGTDPAPAA